MDINMVGPAIVMGLGCIGSSIGCGIAGMASHGVMSRVDEGYGKYIAISAIPSSQSIFGFILMIVMKGNINAGTLSPIDGIAIGLFVGLAIMFSSIFQGKCAVTAIQASAKQPAIYGRTLAAVGIVESFAIFAVVFALLLM